MNRVGLCIILLAGCSAPKADQAVHSTGKPAVAAHSLGVRELQLKQRAESLARLDPHAEAQAAISRGDLHFIGLCAYTCFAPGIADSMNQREDSGAMKGDSLRIIEGTSETVAGPDAQPLGPIAERYALVYNDVILKERRRRHP